MKNTPDSTTADEPPFREADAAARAGARRLLTALDLPTEDLGENVRLFCFSRGEELLATGGLEFHGPYALLRSVGVAPAARGQGLGRRMAAGLETVARQSGVRAVYLLTTTAEAFFARQGYSRVARESVPEPIRLTSEFSSVCPSSAVVMVKELT